MSRGSVKTIGLGFVAALSVISGGLAHAFVGTIAVGLGEMDPEVGRIQTSFSADATIETEEMTAASRVYYAPGKVRDEVKMGGQQIVTINRFDLKKVWMILGQGMYMEVDPEKGSQQAPKYTLISREVVGTETVNGMETTKYKSVYEGQDGKFGGFTWFTDDNIAVKGFLISETNGEKQRVKFEFSNLQRGAQADTLFEIPEGYQALNLGSMPSLGQMRRDAEKSFSGPPPGSVASKQAPAPVQEGDENFVLEVAQEAQDAATEETNAAKEDTKKGVRESVRKGIGKLFGR
jgi:outer membrane lipoprotein-sorting protein